MRKTEWTWDYAFNPKAGSLAVLVSEPNADLKVIVSSIKAAIYFRHKVGVITATDGMPENLEWSQDGSLLLVAAGVSDVRVHVIDLAGREVIPPVPGIDAHWLGPDHAFVYNSTKGGLAEWTKFDIETGKRTRLFTAEYDSASYINPTASPDGKRLAFTEQENGHVVWYDFKTRKLTLIKGNHAYPIWLDNDTIAFSGAAPCNCEYPAFATTGAVGALSLSTGRWTRMNMTDTSDAQVIR
jgi:Tol biopolymer transport system component